MSNIKSWVDTGFLVALFARSDKHHTSACQFLKQLEQVELHSICPAVVEACFFLDMQGKIALLQWIERGAIVLHNVTPLDFPNICAILGKYHNLNPDFTDAALVALAGSLKVNYILTVDQRDFSIYRLPDGSSFERLWI